MSAAGAVSDHGRLERLQQTLGRRLNVPDVRVRPFREGVDCWVDLAEWPGGPPAVVRSARVERLMTSYDGLVDFGAEIEKQVVVAGLLRGHGIPTPAVLDWSRSPDGGVEPSWMLLERVEQGSADWSDPVLLFNLGEITRRIHAIEPPADLRSLLPPSPSWGSWVTDRIFARLAAASTYLDMPDLERARRAVEAVAVTREAQAHHLLHLDLRPPNLAVAQNRIVSVLDLANAIIGDPWLELARLRGCGLLMPAFLQGYGNNDADMGAALDVYELDLSALLVVVSKEEFDDPNLHAEMSGRTRFLLERVLERAGP